MAFNENQPRDERGRWGEGGGGQGSRTNRAAISRDLRVAMAPPRRLEGAFEKSGRVKLLRETVHRFEKSVRAGTAGMGAFRRLQDARVSLKKASDIKLGRKLAE